jgi:regulator of replication initiation timing
LKDIQEFRSKRALFNKVTYLEKTLEQKKRELALAMKDIDDFEKENERLNLKLKLLSSKGEIK